MYDRQRLVEPNCTHNVIYNLSVCNVSTDKSFNQFYNAIFTVIQWRIQFNSHSYYIHSFNIHRNETITQSKISFLLPIVYHNFFNIRCAVQCVNNVLSKRKCLNSMVNNSKCRINYKHMWMRSLIFNAFSSNILNVLD